jgi:serine/threonine protein kinase
MCRAQCTFMCRAQCTSATQQPCGAHPPLPTIIEGTLLPSKPAATMSNNRKQAFMKRSLAHRTVSYIENEVEKMKGASPFLQSGEARADIALLKRDEMELGKLVGQGGFSEVYQLEALNLHDDDAEHDADDDFQQEAQNTSQDVREQLAASASGFVVKHLRKDLLLKRNRFQTAAADLVLEAQFLARLDHPNIIKVRGWTSSGIAGLGDGQHDGYFLVMDKLDCTLAHKIQEWKEQDEESPNKYASSIANLELKLRYARELASALEYLHQNRLVFRDLKPENIGILNDSIVLFDFGLCRELPESSSMEDQFEMSGVGTLRFMAPEIMLQQPYNQKVDVYSFSMVLYEMLFHSKPFELYTFQMHQLLVCEDQERPNIPSYCPPLLRELLEDTWNPEPLDRPCLKEIQTQLQQASNVWKPRFQLLWQSATRPFNTVHKSFSFASLSERTTSTAEESSIGSWFVSSN